MKKHQYEPVSATRQPICQGSELLPRFLATNAGSESIHQSASLPPIVTRKSTFETLAMSAFFASASPDDEKNQANWRSTTILNEAEPVKASGGKPLDGQFETRQAVQIFACISQIARLSHRVHHPNVSRAMLLRIFLRGIVSWRKLQPSGPGIAGPSTKAMLLHSP